MRFSLMGPSGVGVSFHEHVVEVVRVDGRGPFPVVGHVLIPFPAQVYENGWVKDIIAFTDLFRSRLTDAGLATGRPTLCLPTSAVVLRTVTLPRTGRKQARNLIQFQLSHELHLPFADPVFDFDYYPPGFPNPDGHESLEEGVPVLLAAAPGELVHRLEQVFRRMKTPLGAVEVKGLASLRVLRNLGKTVNQGTLLVHFGPDAVDVHFYVKGQLLLSRWLDLNPLEYSPAEIEELQGGSGVPGQPDLATFAAAGAPTQAEVAVGTAGAAAETRGTGVQEGSMNPEAEPGARETGSATGSGIEPAPARTGLAAPGTWMAMGRPGANLSAFAADLQYQIDRLFSFLQYTLRQEDLAVTRLWLAGYVPHAEAISAGLSTHLALPVEVLETPRDSSGNPVDLPALGAALRGMVPDED
ncbi:hypothetical protein CVV65_15490 [Kyrpidia spormannii]|uniref:Tfp pilus assembly protein ATPase PilM-like protein n=1 Tax=Kyrpidia spormannii TaxID=2055160 RepID=A0A2K8N9Y7_9BACL|nr:hypothetical protein [Kyrpidia spormannii]ATY86158.1 hypothetical protein CVV65_15490 [Kyrpidia spormannii]